jgi:hypothetical protein
MTALTRDVPRWFGDRSEDQEFTAISSRLILAPPWTLENRGSSRRDDVEDYQRTFDASAKWRAKEIAADTSQANVQIQEEQVAAAIASIREAHEVADKVFVVVFPRDPCSPPVPKDLQQTESQVLERVVREGGGASMIDFTSEASMAAMRWTCDEFVDSEHPDMLNGASRLSRALSQQVARLL